MTENLRAKLESFEVMAARLNKATAQAGQVIDAINAHLEKLGIGIAAKGEAFLSQSDPEFGDDGEPTGKVVTSHWVLAYGRFQGKFQVHAVQEFFRFEAEEFRVAVGDEIGYDPIPINRLLMSWSSCPRPVKLVSMVTLDSLLDNMEEFAGRITANAEEAMENIGRMLESIIEKPAEAAQGQGTPCPIDFTRPTPTLGIATSLKAARARQEAEAAQQQAGDDAEEIFEYEPPKTRVVRAVPISKRRRS